MGRLRCASVILPLVLASATAQAEGMPAPRTMSLDEAIAHARAHQPEIRAALSRVAAQKEAAEVPRGEWLPSVGVTVQLFGATANNTTGTFVSPGNFDLPRIGATRAIADANFRPYASTIVAGGLTQEVFDFGRIAARSAAEDALVDVAKQQSRATTLGVTFNVEEAYFAVLAAKSVVKASDEAYERSKVHRDLAQAGVVAGLRSPIELTRAEADLARFDIGRVRAQGGLTAAQVTLAATVGVDDGMLDATVAPTAPPDMPELSAAIREAARRDPRILETVAQLHAEEQRTRAIGAESRPDLSFTGTLSGRAGGAPASGTGEVPASDGWLPTVPNWNVGIVFTWPLFDGVVRAREDASRAREQVRRDELASAKQQTAAQIRIAYSNVEVARTTLPRLEGAVAASRANYDQADARFRAGLGTSVELADAEAVRTDTEIQLALGQFSLARARAVFGRAVAEGL